MPQQQVNELLTRLHQSFAQGGDISSEQKHLLDELERHRHSVNEADPGDPKLNEILDMLLIDYENSHPDQIAFLRKVIATLGDIGI